METNNKIKNIAVIERLVSTIALKRSSSPTKSYVSKLLSAKNDLILKKIGEEATEVIIAGKTGEKKELISEVADLFFHLLVTLEHFDVKFDDVLRELKNREGISGIDEKNSRPLI